jgi:transposase
MSLKHVVQAGYTKAVGAAPADRLAQRKSNNLVYRPRAGQSTGCQWRAVPKDLPPRSTLHGWLIRWHCDGVLDRLHAWPGRGRLRPVMR